MKSLLRFTIFVMILLANYVTAAVDPDSTVIDSLSTTTIADSQLHSFTSDGLKNYPFDNFTDAIIFSPFITRFGNTFLLPGARPYFSDVKYYLDGVDVTYPLGTPFFSYGLTQMPFNMSFPLGIPDAALSSATVFNGAQRTDLGPSGAGLVSFRTKRTSKFSAFVRTRFSPSSLGFAESFFQGSNFLTRAADIEISRQIGNDSHPQNYASSPKQMFLDPGYKRYEMGVTFPIPILFSDDHDQNINVSLFTDFTRASGFLRNQQTKRDAYLAKIGYSNNDNFDLSVTYANAVSDIQRYNHNYSLIVSTGDTLYEYNPGGSEPNKSVVGSVVSPDGQLIPVKDYDMLDNLGRPHFSNYFFHAALKHHPWNRFSWSLDYSQMKTAQRIHSYDPFNGKELQFQDLMQWRFANPVDASFFPPGAPVTNNLEDYWKILPMNVEMQIYDNSQKVSQYNFQSQYQISDHAIHFGAALKKFALSFNDSQYSSGSFFISKFNFDPNQISVIIDDTFSNRYFSLKAGLRYVHFEGNIFNGSKDSNTGPTLPVLEPIFLTKKESAKFITPEFLLSFVPLKDVITQLGYSIDASFRPMEVVYWKHKIISNSSVPDFQNDFEKVHTYQVMLNYRYDSNTNITINGYSKSSDEFLVMTTYFSAATNETYRTPIEMAMENQGVAIGLHSRLFEDLKVSLNYHLSKISLTDFKLSPEDIYNNRQKVDREFKADWDVPSVFTMAINYHVPAGGGVSIGRFNPFAESGISLLYYYRSGRPYTGSSYVFDPKHNDKRYPSLSELDIKFYKNIVFDKRYQARLFLEVFNLTNTRVITDIADLQDYENGVDSGDGLRNNPQLWSPPRQIRLGFEISI